MDENLKKILNEIQENEKKQEQEIRSIEALIERFNDQMQRFEEGINQDIEDGFYKNIPEDRMQQLIEEGKNEVRKNFNNENGELEKQKEDLEKQKEENKNSDYKKISSAIKEYHTDMVVEGVRAKRELEKIEREQNQQLQDIEKEEKEQLEGIEKDLKAKEAQYTHLIISNRDSLDQEGTDITLDIRVLQQEIQGLKVSRDGIKSEFKTRKDVINNEFGAKMEEQNKYLQRCKNQKESASKLLGQMYLSEKSIDEIYEILFDEKENVEEKSVVETSRDAIPEKQEEPKEVSTEPKNNAVTSEPKMEKESKTVPNEEVSKTEESKPVQAPMAAKPQNVPVKPAQNKIDPIAKKEAKESVEKEENKKVAYEFYVNKIKYDGANIILNQLLAWYDKNEEEIENAIFSAMGDKENIGDFVDTSDKLLYLSIVFINSVKTENGIKLDEVGKARLEEYYKIWSNPKDKKESNMEIKYNLKGISAIARFFNKSELTDEEIQNVKDNAFLLRDRDNVSIEGKGLLTTIEFKIKDMLEKSKQGRLGRGDNKENNKEEKETEKSKLQSIKSWVLTPKQKEAALAISRKDEIQKPEEEKEIKSGEER